MEFATKKSGLIIDFKAQKHTFHLFFLCKQDTDLLNLKEIDRPLSQIRQYQKYHNTLCLSLQNFA